MNKTELLKRLTDIEWEFKLKLLKKDVSLPRNPVIAKLFRNVKLAENVGYGFNKMLKWEKETYTRIHFENSIDFSFVTFNLPKITDDEQNAGQVNSLTNGEIPDKHPTSTMQAPDKHQFIKFVYPDSPRHPQQKYRLTAKGIELKNTLN